MSTNSLIQQQHDIIRRTRSTVSDYERAKANAEARLKREKEGAEATRRSDLAKAGTEIAAIRQAMKSTQDAINSNKWQDKVAGGIPSASSGAAMGVGSAQQLTQCRSTAELTSGKIFDFLKKDRARSDAFVNHG